MTKSWAVEKLAALRQQRQQVQQQIQQLTANLHAHDGAIQVLEEALQAEADTPTPREPG